MKKFNLFIEQVFENINEARIPNREKFYKLDLDSANSYVNSLSEDSSKKNSFVKMLNSLADKNKPFTLEELKKSLKNVLLGDLSLSSAQSMALEFIQDLNARDAFERVQNVASEQQKSYSEDIAQEILKQLQDGPQTKQQMYKDLGVKFPAFLEGGSDKHEADFSLVLSNLLKEKEIEKIGDEYQISSSQEEDYNEEGQNDDLPPEIEEIDDLEDEEPEELKKVLSFASED